MVAGVKVVEWTMQAGGSARIAEVKRPSNQLRALQNEEFRARAFPYFYEAFFCKDIIQNLLQSAAKRQFASSAGVDTVLATWLASR